ncbi:MAG: alanine dehydrogenase [Candidatus Hadarchaeum sp.]|uniref:alanine dehydrogenase n=1 Tax=Candidatus Hadarchaeum sp. TaxID=2883567 RepID=UPI003D0FBC35
MKVLLLSKKEIEGLISMREVINAVEKAFIAKGLGKVQMPPKSYINFEKYGGDFRVMPAYLEDMDAAGVKIVNVHPRNPKEHRLPTVMATILLLDPKTGAPLTIMDGTLITNLRTGAGGAVAAKYLARRDSRVVAMLGAGVQARTQLLGLNEVLKIEEVRINDTNPKNASRFAAEMEEELGVETKVFPRVKETVETADVIVTTTPSTKPILMNEHVRSGTHINAIGADAPGKQELDPAILLRAKVVVDDIEQAIHGGEVNVPLAKGLISRGDIYADLGEIVTKKKPGRTSHDEITVFDSTGLAIQDIATDWYVYRKAKRLGKGKWVELL